MDADERLDGAREIRAGASFGPVDDERAVRAPRRVAADGIQVGATVRSGRGRRSEGAQSCPTWMSASNGSRGRGSRRAAEEDARLGRTEAPSLAAQAGAGVGVAVPEHRLRHPEETRPGQEATPTSEVAASGSSTHSIPKPRTKCGRSISRASSELATACTATH